MADAGLVGHMMNELAQVQDTLAKLVALYPESLSGGWRQKQTPEQDQELGQSL